MQLPPWANPPCQLSNVCTVLRQIKRQLVVLVTIGNHTSHKTPDSPAHRRRRAPAGPPESLPATANNAFPWRLGSATWDFSSHTGDLQCQYNKEIWRDFCFFVFLGLVGGLVRGLVGGLVVSVGGLVGVWVDWWVCGWIGGCVGGLVVV